MIYLLFVSNLRRIPVLWTTGPGGLGLSVFYSQAGTNAGADLVTFFTAIKGAFPTAVTWQVPTSGDLIEHTTGQLTGSWSGGTGGTVNGGPNTVYAAGTGAYARWLTNTVRNGRKFVGRTFLAPLVSSLFDANGTIDNANLASLQTAANALVTAGTCVVWGRPTTPGGSDGLFAGFTGAQVPDKVTSLKSRRS